jgi:acetylornithine deacetylase/succinyl-diaminopimelate desuccinylase-like protein
MRVASGDLWLRENPPQFEWGGSSMIVDRGEIFPSLEIDPDHPAVQTLMASHESVLRQQAVVDVSATVTDGGWFGDAGIPAAIYGPGDLQNAHAVNEQLPISRLVDYTKVILTFIYEWGHMKK